MTSRHEQGTGTARVRPLTALSASRHQSPSSHLSQNQLHVKTDPGYETRVLEKEFKFSCCFNRMALPSECQDPVLSRQLRKFRSWILFPLIRGTNLCCLS